MLSLTKITQNVQVTIDFMKNEWKGNTTKWWHELHWLDIGGDNTRSEIIYYHITSSPTEKKRLLMHRTKIETFEEQRCPQWPIKTKIQNIGKLSMQLIHNLL